MNNDAKVLIEAGDNMKGCLVELVESELAENSIQT